MRGGKKTLHCPVHLAKGERKKGEATIASLGRRFTRSKRTKGGEGGKEERRSRQTLFEVHCRKGGTDISFRATGEEKGSARHVLDPAGERKEKKGHVAGLLVKLSRREKGKSVAHAGRRERLSVY